MPDLGRSSGFLRADSAVKVGINRGFAMPCTTPGREHLVLAFLSALGTPIARRVEIWRPEADALYLSAGFCESVGVLEGGHTPPLARGQGSIGRTWLTGLPSLATELAGEPAAAVPGLQSLAVIPVLHDARFVAALALYF